MTTTTIKEDLATEILHRRRKQMPRLTAALAAAVLVAVGILAGVEIQKHWGSSSGAAASSGTASSLRAAFASRFGGGSGSARAFGGGGAFGAPGGFGDSASGTVTLVKGTDIYVTEASGNTVLVHTSGSQVTKTVTGSVKSIHPGDTVSVNGTQASNGSWSASRITLTPAGSSNG